MSQSACEIVPVNALQAMLDSAFANQNNMAPPSLPFLDHIMSEGNRSQSTIKFLSGTSKVRQVEIQYDQPFLESEIETNLTGCTATSEECDYVETYTFDPTENVGKTLLVSPSDLTGTAEENCAFIARKIQKRIDLIKENVSLNLAAAAAAQFGRWSVDTDTIDGVNVNAAHILEVNTTLDNGTNARIVNSPLFEQIQLALSMSRINGAGIFGAAGLASYIRRAVAGSQDGTGYDLLAMIQRYGIAAVYDRHLTAALASVNATNLAVGMGSIVPVGFSLYEAECNKLNDSSNVASTIYDPATGMKFDYRMTRPCDDWNIVVKASYQFYTAPDFLYKVGSNFEGVKGLAAIEVVCTDLAPCAA